MNQFNSNSSTIKVVKIPHYLRWEVYLRLQELSIPCYSSKDGYLLVEINTAVAALQLCSVLQQITASRQELVNWLEKCWLVEG
jgi:hypothetical protein